MNWALFCQIEVILLTVGLVVSFVVSVTQGVKDNSFIKRIAVVAKAIQDSSKNLMKKGETNDE